MDSLRIKQRSTGLCLNLKCLTDLKVSCNYSCNSPTLLIEIIQNLTMLKRLKFVGALIDEEISSDLFYSNVCNVHIGKLESLCLADFGIEDADDSIKKTNLLFNIILNSCPNLKTIKLEDMGDINARGNINLYFRKNQFLQHIELDMSNCRFYAFYHEFGKRWRSVGDQITMEDVISQQEHDNPFCVNLAWDASKRIEVKLSGRGL